MTQAIDLDTVLREAMLGTLHGLVHVAMLGVVTSYDRTTQTASVQPILQGRKIDEEGTVTSEALPPLGNVPVLFPQGGGCSITWDLAPDDQVLLVICERSLDEWKATGSGDIAPRDPRRFDPSDAVAYAGIRSPANKLTQVKANTMVVAATNLALGSMSAAEAFVLGTTFKTLFEGHGHGSGVGPTGSPINLATGTPAILVAGTHLSTKIKGE